MTSERQEQPLPPHPELDEHIDAAPEDVFEYITDPERFPGVEDGPVTLGDLVTADAPRHIVWEAEVADGGHVHTGTVEVTLEPDGGGTRVRIVHRLEATRLATRAPRMLALAA